MYEIVEKLIEKDREKIFQEGKLEGKREGKLEGRLEGRLEERLETADFVLKNFEHGMTDELKEFFRSMLAESSSEKSASQ